MWSLGSLRRWEDNIKKDLMLINFEGWRWIELAYVLCSVTNLVRLLSMLNVPVGHVTRDLFN
jgi:hypothetical protein